MICRLKIVSPAQKCAQWSWFCIKTKILKRVFSKLKNIFSPILFTTKLTYLNSEHIVLEYIKRISKSIIGSEIFSVKFYKKNM